MKTVAICQARMGSTRLPGKVLKHVGMYPAIIWVVEAAKRAPGVDQVIVATSQLSTDDVIERFCIDNNIDCFRGSETDVLSRFVGAARRYSADIIVRLTCDCPFLDPNVIGEVVQLLKMRKADYATNTDPPSYPDGLDVEVFTMAALETADREATRPSDRDTVTRFLVRNRHRFPSANLVCPLPGLVGERWVLDSPEDYTFIQAVAAKVAPAQKSYLRILQILEENPGLRNINSKYSRNERFYDGLVAEDTTKRTYAVSKKLLERAEKLIPLGSQTFSKSRLMFPEGAAPLFVTHGDGGYCYDVDGNDYIDLVGGLLPVILGHRDPDVDEAIRDSLSRGYCHSLATTLEYDLAERLCQHIPSAEMVRFAKNGSDVTTVAIRLARHVTGRAEVVSIGYHGWHSWTTDNPHGVTFGERDNTTKGFLGNPPLEGCLDDNYAALIVEPEFHSREKLILMRELCDKHGIVLIFDEIITGFRCGLGGLQKEYAITPDLSTFGKAMANGMPISALVGKKQYMQRLPEIAFSGTFFGETLSMAAAIATIDKLHKHDVPAYLAKTGNIIRYEVGRMLKAYGIINMSIYGPTALPRISFLSNKELQGKFIQEMAKNGILIIGSHNLSFAHKKPEINKLLNAWERTLAAISSGVALEGEIKGAGIRK